MHLLKINSSGDLSLTKDLTDDIPSYAILSHTWGEEEDEVTFNDLATGAGGSKTGYKKIQFCGEQATRDGLQYIWVDTCCIDKSNFTELSEAINSMFRWYLGSVKCYVYLSDVSANGSDENDRFSKLSWEFAFRNSRWFTRGWTLQELIAPVSVEFFSSEGQRLGDKESLKQQIHEVTGISTQAIQGAPLSSFTVNERISWAAKRKTKRKEDAAYSLMGIFDIHMPLIYGEGLEKAMVRLRKQVEESLKNELPTIPSALSSGHEDAGKTRQVPLKPFRVLPFGRNKDFIGRQSLLNQLTTILHTEDTYEDCQCAALVGLGGVGKTQIALEFAFHLQTIAPTISVFWVRASDTASFDNSYREIGQRLEIPGLDNDIAKVKEIVKDNLSQGSIGYWLMIVDNADDFELFYHSDDKDSSSAALSRYLPFSPLGKILFTTRDREAATRYAGSNVVNVNEMDDLESRELLQRSVQRKQLVDDDKNTIKLLKLLVNLPLAIMQVAAYLNAKGCTIVEYLGIYEENSGNVIKLLSRGFEDKRRYPGMKNPIATTWLISFGQIQLRNSLAAKYMAFISCINEQNIPRDILPPAPELDKVEALGTLTAYGFIKERISGVSYDMHRLVHTVMQNWLKIKNEWEGQSQAALERTSKVFPWPKYENTDVWRMYLPHAQCLISTVDMGLSRTREVDELISELLCSLGECSRLTGKFAEAETLCRQALLLGESVLEKDHPIMLRGIHNLAGSLFEQGKYAEAEAINRQSLQHSKKDIRKNHLSILISLSSSAVLLCEQGKYAKAEAINRQTLQLTEMILGKDHPNTLKVMSNLAISLCQQGKYTEAEAIDRQTVQLIEKVLGKDHPSTLQSMNNLANSLYRLGKYAEAELVNRQTLQLHEKVLGKDHPSTLKSMTNLANSLYRLGKYAEAELMNRQALQLHEKVLGKDHPSTLKTKYNFANILCEQGKCVEAEAIYRQTRELQERGLGKDHPDTLGSMHNLAYSLCKQSKYVEAEEINRQTLQLRERVLGKDHLDTLSSMHNLAASLCEQGKHVEAEAIYRQTLQLQEKVLGKDHPDTLRSMSNLATSLYLQGKHVEARALKEEANSIAVSAMPTIIPGNETETVDCGCSRTHILALYQWLWKAYQRRLKNGQTSGI